MAKKVGEHFGEMLETAVRPEVPIYELDDVDANIKPARDRAGRVRTRAGHVKPIYLAGYEGNEAQREVKSAELRPRPMLLGKPLREVNEGTEIGNDRAFKVRHDAVR